MSKLHLFRDFVYTRLSAAALEIFEHYEKTLADCQEEICRSEEKSAQLQRMLDFQPEIKLHITEVQLLSLPEPPKIKEEQDLWISQGGEQLQGLQSDTTDSIFTSPRVKTHCDPEDSSQLPPVDQSPTVENRERDSLSTNTTEEQIKSESDEEDCGPPEPASDSQPTPVTPNCPTACLEEEERGGLLPELTASCPRLLPTRVLKSPIRSRRTRAKCSRPILNLCSSPGPSLRTKTSPSPWTRPITSSRFGNAVRTLKKPWTPKEKAAVHRHLGKNITLQRVPGKTECMACLSKESDLHKRSWTDVKNFIHNSIQSMKKRLERSRCKRQKLSSTRNSVTAY